MSDPRFRDGVFCGLGLAIGVVQEYLDAATTSVDGRELLRSLKSGIASAGAKWSRDDRQSAPLHLSEEVTPT